MLYACLMSVKAVFGAFFTLPVSLCNSMSTITFSQLRHATLIAFKLSFIEVPGWDLAHVRQALPLLEYLEQMISRLGQVGAQVDSCQTVPAKRSFCTGGALATRRVKGWYEARIAAEAEKGRQEQQASLTSVDDVTGGEIFDYFDDTYLMVDWEWDEIMGGTM